MTVTAAEREAILAFSVNAEMDGSESLVELCQRALDGEAPAIEELRRTYGDEIKAQTQAETRA